MFSADVRQFKIRNLLIGLFLFGVGMGLITTNSRVLSSWGITVLAGVAGVAVAYAMMFVSDLLDTNRVDDRKLSSRFFNALGLSAVIATVLLVAITGLVAGLQTLLWLLDPHLVDG